MFWLDARKTPPTPLNSGGGFVRVRFDHWPVGIHPVFTTRWDAYGFKAGVFRWWMPAAVIV